MAVMDGAAFAELVQVIGDNDRQAGLLAASVNEAYEAGRREILREIAKANPIYYGGSDGGDGFCRFCDADIDFNGPHRPDCLWLRAQAVKD